MHLQRYLRVRPLLSLVRAVISPICSRQVQYITVKRLDVPRLTRRPADPSTTCFVVDSVPAVRALAAEFPASFRDSVDDIARRVEFGCLVCVARRKREDGSGYEIVGYELAERGVFSALGRRKAVANDVVFSHWAEVLPAYRGRRIHGQIFAVRDAYFRARGGSIVVGVCAPRNHASLQALHRDGATVVGRVSQLAVLRRVIVWETPWARIDAALELGRRVGALTDRALVEGALAAAPSVRRRHA